MKRPIASTKPSALLLFGGAASTEVGLLGGGWYWLFMLWFFIAVVHDARRVALHEQENGCG